MYSCLPWELRYHIHTFCVQGSYDNEVIVRRAIDNIPALLVRQSIGTHSYQWVEDPILLQLCPDRIGLGPAREILDTYYRTRTFKLIHDDLESVQSFLETDRFELSMRPADHVRRLHLQIQPFRYAQLRMLESRIDEESRCCRALQSLATLRTPQASVDIHVDLAQGFLNAEEDEELLDDAAGFVMRIVDLVRTLRVSGLNVRMTFEGRWNEENGVELCSSSVSSLDDCIYKMKVACR